ncbi:Uncharacterised protein [Streptococcus pneumoniae]|nr:Uncharacterised protein [Streptococcus pneumoniae]
MRGKLVKPATDKMTAIIHAIYRVWCPVKKIYLNRVKRAIKILNTIPANIIIAVAEPYVVKATATIASLFGTTPDK